MKKIIIIIIHNLNFKKKFNLIIILIKEKTINIKKN